MRITSLAAKTLLSFGALELEVPPRLFVLVGPNGSGKTNLASLIRLVEAALGAVATGNFDAVEQEWGSAGWYDAPTFEARIGLDFATEYECALIEDWARGAVVSALGGRTVGRATWCDRALPADLKAAEFLGRGELVVRRDTTWRHPWGVDWVTRSPQARVHLWPGFTTVSAGVHRSDVEPAGPTAGIWDVVRLHDSELPQMSDSATQRDLQAYEEVLREFRLDDLLRIDGQVELVVRKTGDDHEVPSVLRLQQHFRPRWLDSTRDHLPIAGLLDHLLRNGLLVTGNRRLPARTAVAPDDLNSAGLLTDGSGAAVELLRMKTGSATFRSRFADTQAVFNELTGRRLDVRQTLHAGGDEDRSLHVEPVVVDRHPRTGDEVDIPLRFAGAGLEEAAHLALLVTAQTDTLLLDEPGTNLSPTLQRRFVNCLKAHRGGRQTILITHSAPLVPMRDASDLCAVTRLTRDTYSTLVHRPDPARTPGLFQDAKQLLWDVDVLALLFTAGVVLVEGPTELAALQVWLADEQHLQPLPTAESLHVVIIAVGGESAFPKHARLLDAFGIPWAILADGPAFRDQGPLSKLPNPAPPAADPALETFAEAKKRWAGHRVRTFAESFGNNPRKDGEIEAFFEKTDPAAWQTVNAASTGRGKPDPGHRFATQVPVPTAVSALWGELLQDLGMR